jgi:hypothetical protein
MMLLDLETDIDSYAATMGTGLQSEYRMYAPYEPMRVQSPKSHEYYFEVMQVGSFADTSGLKHAIWMQLGELTQRWQRQVLDATASTDVDALTETVEATLELVEKFGPQSLALESIVGERVQVEHLAAVLRASSYWRNTIPSWAPAKDWAVMATVAAGYDPDDVLYGML